MKANLIAKSAIVGAAAVTLGIAALPADASAWIRHGHFVRFAHVHAWRAPAVWRPGLRVVRFGTLGCVRHLPSGGWVNVCIQ